MAFLKVAERLRAFGTVEPGSDSDGFGKRPVLNRMKGVVVNEIFDGILRGQPMRNMMDCIVDVESLVGSGVTHQGVGHYGFQC